MAQCRGGGWFFEHPAVLMGQSSPPTHPTPPQVVVGGSKLASQLWGKHLSFYWVFLRGMTIFSPFPGNGQCGRAPPTPHPPGWASCKFLLQAVGGGVLTLLVKFGCLQ